MIRIFLPINYLIIDDDNNIMTLMYNMNEYITSKVDVVVGISKTKGFLILLGDVISNFGCYLNDVYVDSFFWILLVLLEYYTNNADDNSIVIKDDDVDVKEDDVVVEDEKRYC